ncbi:acyl carrier protein [Pseudoxanthomonas mexicana]
MPQKQQIKTFILQNFLFSDDPAAVGDQDSLIQGGIIDSTGIHELVFFLEDAFKLQIAAEEMTPANFDTIETVERLRLAQAGRLSRRRARHGAPDHPARPDRP